MAVAVVDSGGANISSMLQALGRLGAEPVFTADANTILAADKVILPGVGAAGRAMQILREHKLLDVIRGLTQPVLGVCLGMQLLFDTSDEDDTEMLGLIPARLKLLEKREGLRVPHMGWNQLKCIRPNNLSDPLDNEWFYFVHSYAAPLGEWTLASSDHGATFSAMVQHNNFYGAQFHPERSAKSGATLLRGFLDS
jgi:glutamine amidotransferase